MENPTPGVTTPEKSPDTIEQDMAQTRESITEKVTALETQVLGTIQTATDTVTGTVEAVRDAITSAPTAVSDTVKQTVQAVKDSVRDTVGSIDITGCVQRNPWASVGTTTAAGFVTGYFLFGESRKSLWGRPLMAQGDDVPAPAGRPGTAHGTERRAVPESTAAETGRGFLGGIFGSMFGGLAEKIGTELRQLAEQSASAAMTALKQKINTAVPGLVDRAVERVAAPAAHTNGPGHTPRMSEGSGV